jgi:uncharacterized protein with HEPN domain
MTASDGRLLDTIDRMAEAVRQAITFTDHGTFEGFAADARTQMAVTMAFMLPGECANRLNTRFLEVTVSHPNIPWAQIRGLRNIIAHEY